jgi:hypothetical protein
MNGHRPAPLIRDFKELVQKQTAHGRAFGDALLREIHAAMLAGENSPRRPAHRLILLRHSFCTTEF